MSLPDIPTLTLVVILVAFIIGGMVKGALGGGLPAVGLPILVLQLEPAQAVVLFVAPVILSNIWQIKQAGQSLPAVKRFWPFLVTLVIGVWIGAGALTSLDPKTIALALGCLVIATTLAQVFIREVRVLKGRSGFINPIAGAAIGLCGGATGVFTPVIVYFAALRLPKDLFVAQMAIAAMTGSIPLYLRLVAEDHLSWTQLGASFLALIPTGVGLVIGFWIRDRISEETFRRAVLIGLVLLGGGLIWRGLS